MVNYRDFRNSDPPGLIEVWNEAFTQRGTVRLYQTSPLEYYVLSKPYFDPAGLIVAVDDERPVGFAHAGFGPDSSQTRLCRETGVVCLIAVRPSHGRRGIGSELLLRCEAYLRDRGATTLCAGPTAPLDPFYFGLYGGSGSPGFLVSDAAAEPFLTGHGYQPIQTRLVLQRPLNGPIDAVDGRFPTLRRQYEFCGPLGISGADTWWRESVLGPVELAEFRLEDRATGRAVARAGVWDMEAYWQSWNQHVFGITEVEVREDLRRRGLGRLLVSQLLRQLQEQYFNLAETQVPETDEAAVGLFRSLGFEQVDAGRTYRKPA